MKTFYDTNLSGTANPELRVTPAQLTKAFDAKDLTYGQEGTTPAAERMQRLKKGIERARKGEDWRFEQ